MVNTLTIVPLNSATAAVPFVDAALAVITTEPKDDRLILRSILAILRLNLPLLIQQLLELAESRHLQTTIVESPEIKQILGLIASGISQRTTDLSSLTSTHYELGSSYALSRALILRTIIDPNSYDAFPAVLDGDEPAIAGLFVVLSLRFRSEYKHQKVKLRDGTICRIVSPFPLIYKCVTSDNIEVAFPLTDLLTFRAIPPPFDSVPLPLIGSSPELLAFTSVRASEADQFYAQCARAELALSTAIPAESVRALLSALPSHPPETMTVGSHGSHRKLFRISQPLPSVCFQATPPLIFGFSPHYLTEPNFAFSLTVDKPGEISIPGDKCVIPNEIIRISLIGPAKLVIIQSGPKIILTKHFLGHQFEPSPYFIGSSPPVLVPTEVLPVPKVFQNPGARNFSHVFYDDELFEVADWSDGSHQFHLLPAIAPINPYYLEITTTCAELVVSILDGQSMIVWLFEFPVRGASVVGFGFDPRAHTVFLTADGSLLPESVTQLAPTSYILRATAVSGQFSFVNIGNRPFACRNPAQFFERIGSPRAPPEPITEVAIPEGPGILGALSDIPTMESLFPARRGKDRSLRPAFLSGPDDRVSVGWLSFLDDQPVFRVHGDVVRPIQNALVRSPFDRLTRITMAHQVWFQTQNRLWDDDRRVISSAIVSGAARLRPNGVDTTLERAIAGLATDRSFDGDVSPEVFAFFTELRRVDERAFASLASRALAILRDPRLPHQLIIARNISAMDEYDFGSVDAVWVGLEALGRDPVVVFGGREEAPVLLGAGQITIRGGSIQLAGVARPYWVDVIPIRLSEAGVGFAVQYINYLVKIAGEEAGIAPLLAESILLPLFEDITHGKFLLLTGIYGRWFANVLEKKLIPHHLIRRFAAAVRANALRWIADRSLATAATLFSAYAVSNAETEEGRVRAKIAEFCDESIAVAKSEITGVIGAKIAFELVNPFGNHLQLLGRVGALALPIATRFTDAPNIIEMYQQLKQNLLPDIDSVLCAISLTLNDSVSEIDDSVFKAIPNLHPDVVRWRIFLHKALSMLPTYFIPDFPLASWVTTIQASQRRHVVDIPLDIIDHTRLQSDQTLSRFFSILAHILPVVPIDAGPYFNKLTNGERVSEILRKLTPDIFEPGLSSSEGEPAFLPNQKMANLSAFVGLGRWLAWVWHTGKSLPLPLSRVVLRYAFGGRLLPIDFIDVDVQFASRPRSEQEIGECIKPYLLQLKAVRMGVLESRIIVPDDVIFPLVFQLRPFTRIRGAEASISPFVRKSAWMRKLRFGKDRTEGRRAVEQLAARGFTG